MLFKRPHPKRKLKSGDDSFSLIDDSIHLNKTAGCLKDLKGVSVTEIRLAPNPEKVVAISGSKLLVPPLFTKCLDLGGLDDTARLYSVDNLKVKSL